MKKVIEQIEQKIDENKEDVKYRVRSVLENAKEFVDDHSEGIMYTIIYGGSAILFGQSIRYMHLLNKAAKKGQFFAGNIR
jgi:hypothetical protein